MGVSGCCGGACGVDLSSPVDNSRFFQRDKSDTPVDASQGEVSFNPYFVRSNAEYSGSVSNSYFNYASSRASLGGYEGAVN